MANLYYNAAAGAAWDTLGNWWNDDAFTDPALALPSNGDTVYLAAGMSSGPSTSVTLAHIYVSGYVWVNFTGAIGGATFNGDSRNNGTVNGGATFNDSSVNVGTINGGATFNGSSHSHGGTINGGATFNGSSYNIDTINGGATFNDNGYNNGTVNGGATFNGGSRNSNTINGGATFNGSSHNAFYGTVNGGATFNGGSYNNFGTISGNATFNGGSYNNFGTISGNATFNDNGYNGGTINGNATFNDYSHNVYYGTINGNAAFFDSSYNNGTVTGDLYINGTYYIGGVPTTLDENGNGIWNNREYISGQIVSINTLYYTNANGNQLWGTLGNWNSKINGVGVNPTEVPWTGPQTRFTDLRLGTGAVVPRLSGSFIGTGGTIVASCDEPIAREIIENGLSILNPLIYY